VRTRSRSVTMDPAVYPLGKFVTMGNRLPWLGICLTVQCFYVYIHARIQPSNAFRVVIKVAKYIANVEYGLVEMTKQEHELWLDRNILGIV
jgi:anthranilate/para-aminobenzoate synthase component II